MSKNMHQCNNMFSPKVFTQERLPYHQLVVKEFGHFVTVPLLLLN
jgi:hypothetical protein